MSKRFDSRAWRMAERLAGAPKRAYRYVQRQAPGLVERWDPAAKSAQVPREALDLLRGQVDGMTISEKLEAFHHGVASGAHEVAGSVAGDVYASIPDLVAGSQKRAVAALIHHHVAIGETEAAEDLRRDYEELGATTPLVDPVTISEQIDRGEIAVPHVHRMLRRNWRYVLKAPQLHLLAHRSTVASDPRAATDALNRYLRTQGTDRVTSMGDSGHYLRDLRLAPATPVTGGPLVSVLISSYNSEETIGYAVRSILQQSYQNLEVLVCDDASTDATQELLKAEFGQAPRVSLFRSTANQGTYNVRNALIARARGELITVHDGDDISLPRRIEYQVQQLQNPLKRASVTNLLRVRPDGRIEFFRDRKANRMAIVSLMASRQVFDAMGPYRSAKFGADFEFLERLKAHYGSAAVARIRRPQMLCLWAEQSATQQAGAQALSSGYRSPARRLYSDLVYRQRLLGKAVLSDEEIDEQLRASDNYRDATGIEAL